MYSIRGKIKSNETKPFFFSSTKNVLWRMFPEVVDEIEG